MSTVKRAFLALVSLVLIFVFVAAPVSYAAESKTEGKCGPSLYWNFDSSKGVLTISGEGPMYDYAHFSNTVDAAPYSVDRAKIKRVIIEEGCTKIGSHAFSGLTYLTLVEFPEESLKEIGAYAFNYCESLTRIIVPDSVTSLGEYVFTTCRKLKMVRFGTGITEIPAGACFRASELIDVFFTENCKYIGSSAFYECKKLESVDISSVETIDSNCFFSCISLKSIRFGENIDVIGTNSFYSCSSLSEVIFDGTPSSIPSSFCYGSPWYNSHEEGMYTICDGTILMCRVPYKASEIVIPDGVKLIADSAFANNSSITKVTFPESLEVIGAMAFSRADSLKAVTVPDSVKEIRKNALGYKTEGTSGVTVDPDYVITGRGKGAAYVYAVQNGLSYNCLHEYEYVVESENCTESICQFKKCVLCDVVIEKTEIPANESHSLIIETVSADCENGGYTLYSCENCSYSEKTEITEALGHSSSGKWELVCEPTCEEYGKFAVCCTECGVFLNEKTVEKKGHTAETELRTLVKESCTEDGIYEKYCKNCDATLETVKVSAKGHDPEGDFKTVIDHEEGSAGCEMIRCSTCDVAISVRWFIYENGEKVIIDKEDARVLCLEKMNVVFSGCEKVAVSNYDFNFDGKLNVKDTFAVKSMTE